MESRLIAFDLLFFRDVKWFAARVRALEPKARASTIGDFRDWPWIETHTTIHLATAVTAHTRAEPLESHCNMLLLHLEWVRSQHRNATPRFCIHTHTHSSQIEHHVLYNENLLHTCWHCWSILQPTRNRSIRIHKSVKSSDFFAMSPSERTFIRIRKGRAASYSTQQLTDGAVISLIETQSMISVIAIS